MTNENRAPRHGAGRKPSLRNLLLSAAFFCACGLCAADFSGLENLENWKSSGGKASLDESGKTLVFETSSSSETPTLYVSNPDGWNLSENNIVFTLGNRSQYNHPFTVTLTSRSKDGKTLIRTSGQRECSKMRASRFEIPVSILSKPRIPISAVPPGLPETEAIRLQFIKDFNPEAVVSVSISLTYTPNPLNITLSNLAVTGPTVYEKIFDRYGQYNRYDWPDKIRQDGDFAAQYEAEKKEWAKHPFDNAKFDRYGGWRQGPKLEATGFFRTGKVDRKWWLVTPEGHLFFSLGINSVTDWESTKIDPSRIGMFAELPKPGEPLFQYMHDWDKTFNVYGANLTRKYGDRKKELWQETAVNRLRSWGFNTAGAWSKVTTMPYTVIVDTDRKIGGLAPDPFAPDFVETLKKKLLQQKSTINDSFNIGYFVDNEIAWDGATGKDACFVIAALQANPAELHAKTALLDWLKKKYADIALLNRAWNSSYRNWDDLRNNFKAPIKPGENFISDKYAMSALIADRFYRAGREAVKSVAPNHLYLGSRFTYHPNDTVIRAATEYCDVVSYNLYWQEIDGWMCGLPVELDKPCMIGEFSFGSVDRGNTGCGVKWSSSQEERAERYGIFLKSALRNPVIVGIHWFQYMDRPPSGHWGGECGNFGFVSITDTPFTTMIDPIRKENSDIYPRRFGGMPAR